MTHKDVNDLFKASYPVTKSCNTIAFCLVLFKASYLVTQSELDLHNRSSNMCCTDQTLPD